jgi:hypothetical protein
MTMPGVTPTHFTPAIGDVNRLQYGASAVSGEAGVKFISFLSAVEKWCAEHTLRAVAEARVLQG